MKHCELITANRVCTKLVEFVFREVLATIFAKCDLLCGHVHNSRLSGVFVGLHAAGEAIFTYADTAHAHCL